MTTSTLDPFGNLDTLKQGLERRIAQREEILRELYQGERGLRESLADAQSQGVELFDEDNLSLQVLRGQLSTLEKLGKLADKYEQDLQRATDASRELALLYKLQEADEALKRLDMYHLEYLLPEARGLLWDSVPAHLRDWLKSLEEDSQQLEPQQRPREWQDLQAIQRQLEAEKPLDPEQRQKLRGLTSQFPASRLLAHYRQLDFSYRLESNELAETQVDPDELEACQKEIEELVQAFIGQAGRQTLEPQLRALKTKLITGQRARALQVIFGEWFVLVWQWWLRQAEELENGLDDVSTRCDVQGISAKQMDARIEQLVGLMNQTDAGVFYLFSKKWRETVTNWFHEYGTVLNKSEGHGKRVKDLGDYVNALLGTAAEKSKLGADFWKGFQLTIRLQLPSGSTVTRPPSQTVSPLLSTGQSPVGPSR